MTSPSNAKKKRCLLLSMLPFLLDFVSAKPLVDPGVYVLQGVSTCRNGFGYCVLANNCSVDVDFTDDDSGGHCGGLAKSFMAELPFICCQASNETTTDEPYFTTLSSATMDAEAFQIIDEYPIEVQEYDFYDNSIPEDVNVEDLVDIEVVTDMTGVIGIITRPYKINSSTTAISPSGQDATTPLSNEESKASTTTTPGYNEVPLDISQFSFTKLEKSHLPGIPDSIASGTNDEMIYTKDLSSKDPSLKSGTKKSGIMEDKIEHIQHSVKRDVDKKYMKTESENSVDQGAFPASPIETTTTLVEEISTLATPEPTKETPSTRGSSLSSTSTISDVVDNLKKLISAQMTPKKEVETKNSKDDILNPQKNEIDKGVVNKSATQQKEGEPSKPSTHNNKNLAIKRAKKNSESTTVSPSENEIEPQLTTIMPNNIIEVTTFSSVSTSQIEEALTTEMSNETPTTELISTPPTTTIKLPGVSYLEGNPSTEKVYTGEASNQQTTTVTAIPASSNSTNPNTMKPKQNRTEPYPINLDRCGIKNSNPQRRFRSGHSMPVEVASVYEYCWSAAIVLKSHYRKDLVCNGALIERDLVVTTASCIKSLDPRRSAQYRVVLGDSNLKDDAPYTLQYHDILEVASHPDYLTSRGTYSNDIGIIRLRTLATLSDNVCLVCLPQEGSEIPKENCLVTGYNSANNQRERRISAMRAFGSQSGGPRDGILLKSSVNLQKSQDCETNLIRMAQNPLIIEKPNEFLCDKNTDPLESCMSTMGRGSPLTCEYKGRWFFTGLTSWSRDCVTEPNVYSKISPHSGWILSTRIRFYGFITHMFDF